MAEANASWGAGIGSGPIDPNEKLFLFGYSCKIFRDDEKALYIDKGKHLIPWMGDKSHMIDRYDVRGYLHDLKQYEPKPEGYEDPLSEEERVCDEERYRSLRTDMSEEQLYQEEELKRLRAAIAGDGAYHEIAFTYENAESDNYVAPEPPKVEEPEDELYEIPEGLTVPKEIEVPYNMKIHAIIEKTALFVSEQGGQMEIIIKMKQQANPQFAFMRLDNPLYPYYKHLVKEIKSGAYKPVQVRKVSRSEDEEEDEHYLHPSLMAGRQEAVPKFTVPTINFRRSHDDSYSVLVRNLQQHRAEEAQAAEHNSQDSERDPNNGSNEFESNGTGTVVIVPPPPDLQPVVDKMAQYVAKNGDDFEFIVKSKNDRRFDFLLPGNVFYNYYANKRDIARRAINAAKAENNSQPYNPVVRESGPVLYSNAPPTTCQPQTRNVEISTDVPTVDEFDALYSQDIVFCTAPPEPVRDDTSDSLDFLNSPTIERSPKEESKTKPTKVPIGPISFSLKSRDSDTLTTEKTKMATLLLLDDDSEEDSLLEEGKTRKEDSTRGGRLHEDIYHSQHMRMGSSEDVKPQKPSNEVLEAKHAEDRVRDKLLATARERLAAQRKESQLLLEQQKREEQQKKEKQQHLDQQRKDKQLQLERKRKAELFLKMLKKKNPDSTAVVSHILASDKNSPGQQNSDFWSLPDTSAVTSPSSGILFHGDKMLLPSKSSSTGIPGIKTDWSSDSVSEHSGEEEPISMIGEKLSSDPEAIIDEPPSVTSKPERKKKKRKRSRSRSRERSKSDRSKMSHRTKDRRRQSRSPRNYKREKSKKEKQLPAAYAFAARSRSRSRSPRRYRPAFNNWNRRR